MKPSRLSVCLSLACLPAATWGAGMDLADMDIEALLNMKVESASKFAQPLAKAPSSVSVVTHEEIHAQGWRSLAEILRSIKGLHVTYDRSYSYLGVRGFGIPGDYNTRFLLLVDGVRVNDALYEQAYLGNEFLLDVDTIDRVEFVPGAGSSIYGSNAVLGVINVITRNGEVEQGVRLSGELGSWQARQGRFSWGNSFDAGGDLLMSVSRLANGGQALDLPGVGPTPAGMDAENTDKAFCKWRKGEFSLSAAYMQRDKDTPAAPFNTDPGVSGTRTHDRQMHLMASYGLSLGSQTRLETLFDYAQMAYRGDYAYSGAIEHEFGNAGWWMAESRLLTQIGAHRLIAGLEYQDNLEQKMRYEPQAASPISLDSWRAGAYVQDEWTISGRFTLNAGLRHDHYSTFGGTTNPRIALIWQALPDTTVKLDYGAAFRAPSAYELHYQDNISLPNPSLRPETVKSHELIVEQEIGQGRLSATLFEYRIDNLIEQTGPDVSGQFQYRNVGGVEGRGTELGLDYGLGNAWLLRTSLSLQHMHLLGGGDVDNAPDTLFKATLRKAQGAWRPSAEIVYVGDRLDLTDATVKGAWLVNLGLLNRLAPGLEVSVHIRNLFDRRYSDPVGGGFPFSQLPQDGRSYGVKLVYRF